MLLKRSYTKIEPASGAIIMANGIFLIGAVEAFPLLDIQLGKYLAFLLLIAWILIYKSLSIQFFHRDFLIPFIKHPVKSFTMGTWIAGVSVLCNVFLKYFPGMILITQAMAALNTLLWLFFLANCFYNFKQLMFDHKDYPVHGILMISTVGTQSIIILLNNVFFQLPILFSEIIIYLGLLFYLVSLILITKRYMKENDLTLVDDWTNTNCIIHGALSITGLAIVVSHSFTALFVNSLWVIILLLIIIVETIEVTRAILRIKLYGWNKGVFTYHISQWSRNFTFGMFYAFTLYMHHNPAYLISNQLYNFQKLFMLFWGWLVLLTLLGQIAIYLKSRIEKDYFNKGKPDYI